MILHCSPCFFRSVVKSGPLRHPPAASALTLGAVMVFLSLMSLAPAAAHDVITATDPGDGSVLASVPAGVQLSFNNTPIALGAAVQITDGNGVDQSDGAVVISDNHVAQAIKAGAPAGPYTVTWRVVSSDSHPIEGLFIFTAGKTPGSFPPTTPPASPLSAAGAGPGPTAGVPWALAAGGSVIVASLLATARYVRWRLREGNGGAS